MKRVISLFALIAFFAAMNTATASGQSKERRDMSGFDGIGFGISGNLYVKTGSGFDVRLEGDASYLNDIKTVVRNGKLHIYIDKIAFFRNEKADVFVTLPVLTSLSVSGSGKAIVESPVKGENIDFSVSGSGRLETESVESSLLDCSISGSGDIFIKSGKIGKAKLQISGSGGFSAEEAEIKEMETGISGSGSCRCNVTESLSARISGSGNVIYSGNPRLDVRSSGSGHVRSK
jgi:hypothetical protein